MRIVIHIGASKCGSSSIQYMLALNKDLYLKDGILIPDQEMGIGGNCSGEQINFFQQFYDRFEEGVLEIETKIRKLVDYSEKNGVSTIVLSAENLSSVAGFERLFEAVKNDYDFEVILYIRRQDDYFTSSWQQWFLKEYPDFFSFVIENIGRYGNWQQCIDPWMRMFGPEHVTVRLFDKSQFINDSLLSDFAYAARLPHDQVKNDFPHQNQSLTNSVSHIASSLRDVFIDIHDNRFYEMFHRGAGKSALKKPDENLLTSPQRLAVLGNYVLSNSWVKDNFFQNSKLPNDLFDKNDLLIQNNDALNKKSSQDEMIELMSRIIFSHDLEIERLKHGDLS